jgi:hypothetical protein
MASTSLPSPAAIVLPPALPPLLPPTPMPCCRCQCCIVAITAALPPPTKECFHQAAASAAKLAATAALPSLPPPLPRFHQPRCHCHCCHRAAAATNARLLPSCHRCHKAGCCPRAAAVLPLLPPLQHCQAAANATAAVAFVFIRAPHGARAYTCSPRSKSLSLNIE